MANRRLLGVGRHRYAIKATSARYTMLSQPSSTNQRVRQCVGAKSFWPTLTNIIEFKKKKPKMTTIVVRMHHHSRRYMPALTCCLRSTRSFIVMFSELSVQM
jgi:hypothetical protein